MKYTIHWLEYIYPDSYCDELDISIYEIDSEENKENYEKVLKAIKSYLPPNSRHTGGYYDNWEFECADTFEADNIDEAKDKALEYECGQEGIFAVSCKGEKLFDEQDL